MRRLASFAAGLAVLCTAMAVACSPALASTTPGWWACEKAAPKHSGHYSDKGCTAAVESGGGYELQPGIGRGKGFKGKSTERSTLTVAIPNLIELKIECGVVKESGQAATPNRVVGVTLAFSKCEVANFHEPCASFTTAPLSGELGWIDKEAGLVGVSLTDEAAPGAGFIAQIECPSVAKLRIHGAFIGRQTGDVHQLSPTSTTTWEVKIVHAESGFDQIVNTPSAFEAGPEAVLLTELNDVENHHTWGPEGGYPSGQEASVAVKGENLMIQ